MTDMIRNEVFGIGFLDDGFRFTKNDLRIVTFRMASILTIALSIALLVR